MKLTFGVIGPGKVGSSLVMVLGSAGLACAGVCGGAHAAVKAAELGVPHLGMAQLARAADIIFICTPDRAISQAAAALAEEIAQSGIDVRGKYAYHVSGSAGTDKLAALAVLGMETGSLHPLQSFAAPRADLKNIGMAADGTEKARGLAVKLAELCGASAFIVPPEERAAYHAAACFCSNYVVTAVALAQGLLARWTADENAAFKLLLPLFNGTAQNLLAAQTAGAALTGPIARGDTATLAAHIKALPQEFLPVYAAMGLATVKLALKNGSIGQSAAAEMEKLLTEANK